MTQTRSATPLQTVHVEPGPAGTTHVWLRRNIEQTEEGWEADEMYFLHPDSLTAEQAAADFDALWAAHAPAPDIQAQIDDLTDLILGIEPLGTALADRLISRGAATDTTLVRATELGVVAVETESAVTKTKR